MAKVAGVLSLKLQNPENSTSTASTSSLVKNDTNNQLVRSQQRRDNDQVSDAGSCLEDEAPGAPCGSTLPDLNLDLSMSFPSSSSLGINKDEDKEKKLNIDPNLSQQELVPSSAATLVLFQ
ncbi:hypothetical protein Pint_22240 [Pistacia integerrima]|uniref:Uncharacterized protein n=1 Tax=Pistacia integerrima TaxID=434235 RepID=A0ACC0YJ57_9ROSI|nr:hypothetical protein Pint_22240 [Pistacia integerrima]